VNKVVIKVKHCSTENNVKRQNILKKNQEHVIFIFY